MLIADLAPYLSLTNVENVYWLWPAYLEYAYLVSPPLFSVSSPHSPVQSPHSSPPHSPHLQSAMATSNIPDQLTPEPFKGTQDVDLWMKQLQN